MAVAPLVTCIMLTRDRRQFIRQAVTYVLRQSYPALELVVVDDGARPAGDLIPHDDRIRYLRLPQRRSLGARRNLACEIGRGEFIAHWDDDDWVGPSRVEEQLRALLAAGAICSAADALLHYRLDEGDAWLFRPHEGSRERLAAGTLLYRREAWRQRPFADTDDADADFAGGFGAGSVCTVSDPSYQVGLVHAGGKACNTLDPRWQRRPVGEVSARLGDDQDFYIHLRAGRHASEQPPAPPATRITLAGTFVVYDGYGSMAEYLALGLARAGATVDLAPLHVDRAGLSPALLDLLDRARPERGAPALCFTWWGERAAAFQDASDLFYNTMWESSRIPADWPARLNRARAVIVPSRFVQRVFRECGVTAPVEVVPQGVDPAVYHFEERPERPGVVTLMVGVFVARKNVHEGIAAWKAAFAGDPHARLIIKSRFQWQPYQPDDPRITFVDTNEATRGIAHWYREADVLLALGNEGFGLPLVEAMATGLPVIALDSEGQAEVCEEAPDCVLAVPPSRWLAVEDAAFGDGGVRAVPAVEEVAARLRWVAAHLLEARALGRRASAWATRQRDVWQMGPATLAVMERHVRPPRPLRRVHTVWAAGSGRGAAAAAALAAMLPSVRVVQRPPDLRGVRTLHVEYEAGVCDEGDLLRAVQQARYSGVPVVVTVHEVDGRARAWEGHCDAFVATSEGAAAALGARWPGTPVHLLPPAGEDAAAWRATAEQHLAIWQNREVANARS